MAWNTPNATTGVTPAALMFGCSLQTKLDIIRHNIRGNVQKQQSKMLEKRRSTIPHFCLGQEVMVRDYREKHQK